MELAIPPRSTKFLQKSQINFAAAQLQGLRKHTLHLTAPAGHGDATEGRAPQPHSLDWAKGCRRSQMKGQLLHWLTLSKKSGCFCLNKVTKNNPKFGFTKNDIPCWVAIIQSSQRLCCFPISGAALRARQQTNLWLRCDRKKPITTWSEISRWWQSLATSCPTGSESGENWLIWSTKFFKTI